jgi:hypothetical protein
MRIDWTIDFGNIVTIVLMVFASLGYIRRLEQKVDRIGIQVGLLWKWFKREHGINGNEEDG